MAKQATERIDWQWFDQQQQLMGDTEWHRANRANRRVVQRLQERARQRRFAGGGGAAPNAAMRRRQAALPAPGRR
jgi:hypothetical protein